MTKLMEQVVAEASKLPADEQDRLAAEMLESIRGDQLWDEKLAATTPEQWDHVIEGVRADIRKHGTLPLDPDAL